MSKQVTLALLGFNAKLQAVFSAILVLSEISLNDDWKIVDKKIANIIFVNSDQLMSQKQWDETQLNYPEAILIAYSKNLEPLNTKWQLLTKADSPPQRSLLITLLNKLTVALSQVTKGVEKEVIMVKTVDNDLSPIEVSQKNKDVNYIIPEENLLKESPINDPVSIIEAFEKKPVEDKYFLPEHYFLGIVQKSIQTGKIYHCKTPCNINIYLFPAENSYFCSLNISDLSSLFLIYIDEIEIKEFSEKQLNQETEHMKRKVITDLLWYSTVIASQGRLMKNRHRSEIIHLKYWPDISYINISESYLVIAMFMQCNKLDIKRIAAYTEQKITDVIDFYNACHVLGLINYNEEFYLKSRPASDKLRNLRKSIFKTLQLDIINQ